MQFLQTYQESISYESSGVIPDKNQSKTKDNDQFEHTQLTAQEIWEFVKSGPKKGQVIPNLDKLGNVVVDPAGNILKEQYLLDFNIYKALHSQASKKDGSPNLDVKMNNSEKKAIKELFAAKKRQSLFKSGVPISDARIRPYEVRGNKVDKILKKQRGGQSAGNVDLKVVGEMASKESAGALYDMPKFTPYNCNFFKQTITQSQQARL